MSNIPLKLRFVFIAASESTRPHLLSSCCMKLSERAPLYMTASCPWAWSITTSQEWPRPDLSTYALSSSRALLSPSAFSIRVEMFRPSTPSLHLEAIFTESLPTDGMLIFHSFFSSFALVPSVLRLRAGSLLFFRPNQLAMPLEAFCLTSVLCTPRSCSCSFNTFSSMPFITFCSMADCGLGAGCTCFSPSDVGGLGGGGGRLSPYIGFFFPFPLILVLSSDLDEYRGASEGFPPLWTDGGWQGLDGDFGGILLGLLLLWGPTPGLRL